MLLKLLKYDIESRLHIVTEKLKITPSENISEINSLKAVKKLHEDQLAKWHEVTENRV